MNDHRAPGRGPVYKNRNVSVSSQEQGAALCDGVRPSVTYCPRWCSLESLCVSVADYLHPYVYAGSRSETSLSGLCQTDLTPNIHRALNNRDTCSLMVWLIGWLLKPVKGSSTVVWIAPPSVYPAQSHAISCSCAQMLLIYWIVSQSTIVWLFPCYTERNVNEWERFSTFSCCTERNVKQCILNGSASPT